MSQWPVSGQVALSCDRVPMFPTYRIVLHSSWRARRPNHSSWVDCLWISNDTPLKTRPTTVTWSHSDGWTPVCQQLHLACKTVKTTTDPQRLSQQTADCLNVRTERRDLGIIGLTVSRQWIDGVAGGYWQRSAGWWRDAGLRVMTGAEACVVLVGGGNLVHEINRIPLDGYRRNYFSKNLTRNSSWTKI